VNQSQNASDSLVAGTYTYSAFAKDSSDNENKTETRYITVDTTDTTPIINSTDGTNKTLQDLNCFATLLDSGNNVMNVSIRWFRNNSLNLTINYSSNYANGTFFNAVLAHPNTTRLENWTCSLRVYNGYYWSNWVNSSRLTIINSIPNITGVSPADDNITTNRTPTFNWTATDDDNDALSFDVNITLDAHSTCLDNRSLANTNNYNYTTDPYLKCLTDNRDDYNWSIRAYDGVNYSSWSAVRNISIQSSIIISLPTDNINFGSLIPGNIDNTSDGTPAPFVLRNDGNALTNITANFSNLWNSSIAQNPSRYYQFKARNVTPQCFNYANSVTTWTNATTTNISVIQKLNFTLGYQTGCNNASIDIAIEVPAAEIPANKSSLVTFFGMLGEP
jgi:hypothetical protein